MDPEDWMIDFVLPWALLLLPLPLLAWWWLPSAPEGRSGALRVPFYASLAASSAGSSDRTKRNAAVLTLKIAAWVLLVLAAAQPRWIGEPRTVTHHGRDLMLALDLSGSMATPDFDVSGVAVDRLTVVNAVARSFVQEREGDRVGLILFGTRAYLQAPLTLDRETVVQMLGEAEIGLAGEETAIGDAIGLAVKHLRDRPAEERVLVLLSDGANTTGVLGPDQAAELAARESVRIHSIGIGSDSAFIQTPLGPRSIGAGGLDEAALQRISETTGGRFFRARDTAGLIDVYRQIDALEPTEGDAARVRPTRALFYFPLGASLVIAAALLAWRLASEMGLSLRRAARLDLKEEMAS
jgi:Ca-activated chloride channel family protein